MAKYELVREIENNCARNQMRDVFFSEVETDDPAAYVRGILKDQNLHLERDVLADGTVCIFTESAGLYQKFLFSGLDGD